MQNYSLQIWDVKKIGVLLLNLPFIPLAFAQSQLDYCNFDTMAVKANVQELQTIQNSIAGFVARTRLYDHIRL